MFQIYEGGGEWFDISKKPIERASFTFGGAKNTQAGYHITDRCIGCGTCLGSCPQSCIDGGSVPFVIEQEHCLHCGNCFRDCPMGAIERLAI